MQLSPNVHLGPVGPTVRRLTTDQEIPGYVDSATQQHEHEIAVAPNSHTSLQTTLQFESPSTITHTRMPPRQTTTELPGTSLANMSQWCRSLTAGGVPDETAVGLQDLYAQVVVHVMAELVERREARTVVATQPAQAVQKRRQPSMQQDLNDVLQQQLGRDYWPRALTLWQQEQQQQEQPPRDDNDHASPSLPSLPPPRKKSKKARQREAAANPQLVAEQERLLAASRTKALSSAAPDRTKEKDDTA